VSDSSIVVVVIIVVIIIMIVYGRHILAVQRRCR